MAVTTPTINAPIAAEVLPIGDRAVWLVLLSVMAGGETHRETQVQVATDAGFTALVYDTGLRENDDKEIGQYWAEVYPSLFSSVAPSTTYYLRARYRSTIGTLSSWSSSVSVTSDTALVEAEWEQAQ